MSGNFNFQTIYIAGKAVYREKLRRLTIWDKKKTSNGDLGPKNLWKTEQWSSV